MLIALDYDDTYTRDPEFWDRFIQLSQGRGHQVIVVTMRDDAGEAIDVRKALKGKVTDILFTNRKAKKRFVNELGYVPSVWIDDQPFFIYMDATG